MRSALNQHRTADMFCLRASPLVRVKGKFTVKNAVCENLRQQQHTANVSGLFTLTRTKGVALRRPNYGKPNRSRYKSSFTRASQGESTGTFAVCCCCRRLLTHSVFACDFGFELLSESLPQVVPSQGFVTGMAKFFLEFPVQGTRVFKFCTGNSKTLCPPATKPCPGDLWYASAL